MRFVDTNVLIYAVSPSPEEAYKCRIAQELLSQDDLALSVQVLQEFYHQVTRPTRPHALTHAQAMGFVEIIDRFPIQEFTFDLFHCRCLDQPALQTVILGRCDSRRGSHLRL